MISELEQPSPECEYCGHNTIDEVYESSLNESLDIDKPDWKALELCESCIREAILDGEDVITTLKL